MTGWILAVFLAFYGSRWLVETGLLALNLRHAATTRGRVPAPLAGRVDEATARRSADYTLARGRFALVADTASAMFVLWLLLSGVLPGLEAALRRGPLGLPGLAGIHLSAAFLVALAVTMGLFGLPFSLWRTFVIEQRFGFNRQRWGAWLVDRLKGLAVAAVLGIPFLYGVLALMRYGGPWWWLWAFAFIAGYQVFLLWLYPAAIAPLFNRFTPLPEGELRRRVEALAAHAGFRTKGLSVMDASRRTGHSNAFFTGLGRAKRIVLFDTLVERMTPDETVTVLAHEIGHYTLHHVRKRLAVSVAVTLLALFVLSRLLGWAPLFAAFGFAAPSAHAALALLMLGGDAFTYFVAPLGAWWSRRHEYAADAYSVRVAGLPGALKSALLRLSGENLSNLHPHRWYSAFYYSHPPLPRRLAAIDGLAGAAGPAPAAGGRPVPA